jgi:hypothetical protein
MDTASAHTASARLEGRCHCGAVQVSIPADAIGVVACHCDDCQKLHGNFFAMLVVDRDAALWSGSAERARYRSSPQVERSFCPHCGSRIAKEPDGSPKLLLATGLFPRDLPQRLIRHVHTDGKPDWYPLPPLAA